MSFFHMNRSASTRSGPCRTTHRPSLHTRWNMVARPRPRTTETTTHPDDDFMVSSRNPILLSIHKMEGRLSWIREVVREQEARLSSGKQRKHRVSADGSIGSARPPAVRMITDFAQDANARKRAAAAESTIMKAKAVSDNKYMSRYKDAVKGIHEALEAEAEVGKQVRQHASDRNARMESALLLAREKEDKIAEALKTAKTNTNSTAKGKALASVRSLHAERRAALRSLAFEGARRATDVVLAPPKAEGGSSPPGDPGFHFEDDLFCFFC